MTMDSRFDLSANQDSRTGKMKLAIKKNDVAAIKRLLDSGFDAKQFSYNGTGFLHHAVYAGDHAEQFKLFIDRGADLNKKGDGRTPLVMCIWQMRWKCAKLLLDAGANPNHHGRYDELPLEMAMKTKGSDGVAMTQILLHAGVSLDIYKAKTGKSALDFCIVEQNADLFKLLLAHSVHKDPIEIESLEESLELAKTTNTDVPWMKKPRVGIDIIHSIKAFLDSKKAMSAIEVVMNEARACP